MDLFAFSGLTTRELVFLLQKEDAVESMENWPLASLESWRDISDFFEAVDEGSWDRQRLMESFKHCSFQPMHTPLQRFSVDPNLTSQ